MLALLLAGGALLLTGLVAGILVTSFFLLAAPMPGRHRRRQLLRSLLSSR